ncbi:MAG: APC family permease [Acidimicrobiales bacterium]
MSTSERSVESRAAQAGSDHRGLATHVVGLPGVLFQSVTFMAPGGAVATSLAASAMFAGAALPLSVLLTLVAAVLVAISMAQLARHLPSAGSIYTYPAQGLHPTIGFLVGWGYAMITGLVGPIVNLLIGYFVGSTLNQEFGWNYKASWIGFMLLAMVLTAVIGYRGVKLSTWFGVILGAFEMLVFIALSIWMIAHAAPGGNTLQVFTLKFATVRGYHGMSGIVAGAVFVVLAFVGFEASAPLAEEARDPRRNVPRAIILSCVVVGIFYLFTTYAAAAFVGSAHFATYGGLGNGSPWIAFARKLWGLGWVVVFLAVVNSFFANGNSALIASTRTWYAMGRIRLLPSALERTHRRYASPVVGILVQGLATLVIALPLALGYGPIEAFELLGTILSAVMICIYIVINISSFGYYFRRQRAEFNWFLHFVIPIISSLILIPVLFSALGLRTSIFKFVSPLSYPISLAGIVVIVWFVLGLIYLGYLMMRHRERITDMGRVFE